MFLEVQHSLKKVFLSPRLVFWAGLRFIIRRGLLSGRVEGLLSVRRAEVYYQGGFNIRGSLSDEVPIRNGPKPIKLLSFFNRRATETKSNKN